MYRQDAGKIAPSSRVCDRDERASEAISVPSSIEQEQGKKDKRQVGKGGNWRCKEGVLNSRYSAHVGASSFIVSYGKLHVLEIRCPTTFLPLHLHVDGSVPSLQKRRHMVPDSN